MTQWDVPGEHNFTLPLDEIERREVLRTIRFYGGNVSNAARALKIGKTTMYRKLKTWGYTGQSRILQAQASVLAGESRPGGEHFG
jgi:DNA-binding NtrC family response regulator